MTPNRIYQAVVEALETSLAPRVVSLVLREGLAAVGREPSTLRLEDVETVLTGPAFKHLQARMSADAARDAVMAFRERIEARCSDDTTDAAAAETADAADTADATLAPAEAADEARTATPHERLRALRESLRPFNLYFDWPEVRTLRAQLQVAEDEVASRAHADESLAAADEQLRIVEQKLEDRLVLQARELGELEEALGIVASLGGPRVRRLDQLIGQIRHAQNARELADAETQRAATLAHDLRKLMESSVAQPFAGDVESAPEGAIEPGAATPDPTVSADDGAAVDDLPPVTIDEAQLAPEVSERLRALDVDAERKALETLAETHGDLVRYVPSLGAALDDARAILAGGHTLGERLEALRHHFDDALATQRAHLQAELLAIEAERTALPDDDGGLERGLRVALDVLRDALPPYADVLALRERYHAASARAEERARREREAHAREERRRAQQRALRERLAHTLERAPDTAGEALRAPLEALRSAHDAVRAAEGEDRLDDDALERALTAEQRWEHALAERAGDDEARRRARVRELEARLEALPDLPTLRARRANLVDACAAAAAAAHDDAHLDTLTSLVDQLHADALDAVSLHLERLAKDAGDATDRAVLSALQEGARTLQAGRFPDVERLQALVAETRERLRDAERTRWQRLQRASARLETAGVAGLPALARALAAVRAASAERRPLAPALDTAEAALAQVELEVHERLATFSPRLDAALITFHRVERLNTDEVATVRRVLTHLDAQREALARISPGLQHQLERSLESAERLLDGLVEAFEATRAVADQLVSANLFDDMLGLFDAPTNASAQEDPAPPAAAWRDSEALQALLAGFRGLDDVDVALVIGDDGSVRAGDAADLDVESLADAVRGAHATWIALAQTMGDEAPLLVDLALDTRHALLTAIAADAHALIVVRSDGAVSALTARLRDQRGAMITAVAAAS